MGTTGASVAETSVAARRGFLAGSATRTDALSAGAAAAAVSDAAAADMST